MGKVDYTQQMARIARESLAILAMSLCFAAAQRRRARDCSASYTSNAQVTANPCVDEECGPTLCKRWGKGECCYRDKCASKDECDEAQVALFSALYSAVVSTEGLACVCICSC